MICLNTWIYLLRQSLKVRYSDEKTNSNWFSSGEDIKCIRFCDNRLFLLFVTLIVVDHCDVEVVRLQDQLLKDAYRIFGRSQFVKIRDNKWHHDYSEKDKIIVFGPLARRCLWKAFLRPLLALSCGSPHLWQKRLIIKTYSCRFLMSISMSCKLCYPLSRLLHVGSLSCTVKVNDDDEDKRDDGICHLAST